MSWSRIKIRNCSEAESLVKQIQENFEFCWRTNGSPDEAALFSELDPDAKDRIIYLTPKAHEICSTTFAKYDIHECDKPVALKTLLSGSPSVRKIYDIVGTDM